MFQSIFHRASALVVLVFPPLIGTACSSRATAHNMVIEAGADGGTAGDGGTSSLGGGNGAGAAGHAGTGGGMEAGGTDSSSGGADSGGSGGSDVAGGSGGAASGCAAPYAPQLAEAVDLALGDTFVWQDMMTTQFTGSCYASTTCTAAPCAACSIVWEEPEVLPDATKAYVDFTATCGAPSRTTCATEMWTCFVTMEGTGTATLDISGPPQLDAGILYWPSPVVTVLGTWASTNTTCGYLVAETASADLNARAWGSVFGQCDVGDVPVVERQAYLPVAYSVAAAVLHGHGKVVRTTITGHWTTTT